MIPFNVGNAPELDNWGSVADLGSEIVDGECLIQGKMVHGAPQDPMSCAYFACSKGAFRMTYPFNEHAVVVEGEVTLRNETTGESRTYRPGDGWFVEKGTKVLWTIISERFVKHYLAVS